MRQVFRQDVIARNGNFHDAWEAIDKASEAIEADLAHAFEHGFVHLDGIKPIVVKDPYITEVNLRFLRDTGGNMGRNKFYDTHHQLILTISFDYARKSSKQKTKCVHSQATAARVMSRVRDNPDRGRGRRVSDRVAKTKSKGRVRRARRVKQEPDTSASSA